MLEQIDLSKTIGKQEYKTLIAELEIQLGELQRQARALQIPVIIVFEGWDAAGKGTLINKLLLTLDPRGFQVNPINPPNEEERLRPFLWRFWVKTPSWKKIGIFDRSWYGRLMVERVQKIVKRSVWSNAFHEIKSFEKQLVDGGAVIIKFFLHITKKEQKKRFKKLENNPVTAWKVSAEDWKHHRKYKKYLVAIEEMLEKTDSGFAPWHIIEAHDRRFAKVKVFRTVVDMLEKCIHERQNQTQPNISTEHPRIELNKMSSSILDKVDLSVSVSREQYEKELKKYQKRIRELEHEVYIKRLPVVIVYEGSDAAGKGGNIKRLVRGMDPRGYEVIPIAAPNDIEKAHHYLWRFWQEIPKAGHIAIFDRSWYGRVLVERVEGFCAEEEWKRAYREINEMEEQLTNFGTVVIKFWVQIDEDEQLKRFKARQDDSHKNWKITDEDWRNREKWDQYKMAVDEMLFRTSTSYAPWTIVESNCKWYARIKALKTVIKAVEKQL